MTLSDGETFACDVLIAILGAALVAMRGEHRASLPLTVSTTARGALTAKAAAEVLAECQAYLDAEGAEACLADAADLLEEAELLEEGYILAVGIVLVVGTLSADQGTVLDDIARALRLSDAAARDVRRSVAEAMA